MQIGDHQVRAQMLRDIHQFHAVAGRPHNFDTFLSSQETTQGIQVLW
jgi:hypothetical protein